MAAAGRRGRHATPRPTAPANRSARSGARPSGTSSTTLASMRLLAAVQRQRDPVVAVDDPVAVAVLEDVDRRQERQPVLRLAQALPAALPSSVSATPSSGRKSPPRWAPATDGGPGDLVDVDRRAGRPRPAVRSVPRGWTSDRYGSGRLAIRRTRRTRAPGRSCQAWPTRSAIGSRAAAIPDRMRSRTPRAGSGCGTRRVVLVVVHLHDECAPSHLADVVPFGMTRGGVAMKIGAIVPQGWVGEYDGWEPLAAWRRTTEVARQAERSGSSRSGCSTTSTPCRARPTRSPSSHSPRSPPWRR